MVNKTTTMVLDSEVLERAKKLDINISKVCREAIKQKVEELETAIPKNSV